MGRWRAPASLEGDTASRLSNCMPLLANPPSLPPCAARRKDARSVKIKKTKASTKFKVRCSRYLYTLCVADSDKAEKLKQSLPPGACVRACVCVCWCEYNRGRDGGGECSLGGGHAHHLLATTPTGWSWVSLPCSRECKQILLANTCTQEQLHEAGQSLGCVFRSCIVLAP